VLEYITYVVAATRRSHQVIAPELARYVEVGASPRASIAFARAARACALLQGRDHVIPEDVRHLAHRVLRHRVLLTYEATADDVRVETIIDAVLRAVRTP
jgi:MoxR-like ATPase